MLTILSNNKTPFTEPISLESIYDASVSYIKQSP